MAGMGGVMADRGGLGQGWNGGGASGDVADSEHGDIRSCPLPFRGGAGGGACPRALRSWTPPPLSLRRPQARLPAIISGDGAGYRMSKGEYLSVQPGGGAAAKPRRDVGRCFAPPAVLASVRDVIASRWLRGGSRDDPWRNRCGCFLPDLTGLATTTSARLPPALWRSRAARSSPCQRATWKQRRTGP